MTSQTSFDAAYSPILAFDAWSQGVDERSGFVQRAHDRLQELLHSIDDSSVTDKALRRALDGAALETGAIEGLYRSTSGITISVIDGTIDLAAATAQIKEDVEIEALVTGQRAAYDLALDIVTDRQPISEAITRTIHETVSSGQETYDVQTAVGRQRHALLAGNYKEHPNHVLLPDGTVHAYCPVLDVPSEMRRFVNEVGMPSFRQASASVQSAYLHHCLTHIHPFADGNGRTARVLGSIPLLQRYSVPFVVFADRDGAYRARQSQADAGETSPFVRFVEDSTVDVLNLVSARVEADAKLRPDLTDLAARIEARSTSEPKLGAEKLDRLLAELVPEVIDSLALPESFNITFRTNTGGRITKPSGMDLLAPAHLVCLEVVGDKRSTTKRKWLGVLFDTTAESLTPIAIKAGSRTFEARVDELMPRTSVSLRSRLRAFLEGTVADLMIELDEDYRQP